MEHQDPQLWQVVNESTVSVTEEFKKFVSQGVGYEVKIPLSVLGLESGDKSTSLDV